MEDLWVEVDVVVTVIEKCTAILRIQDPNLTNHAELVKQVEAEAAKQVPIVLADSESMKISNVSYQRKVCRFYPDCDGNPNLYCPIEKEVIQELIDGSNSTN